MMSPDWTAKKAEYRPSGLYIGGVLSVSRWELPLQRAMAAEVATESDVVLEVGYGLGLASARIQAERPRVHVVVEAHPDVAAMAIRERVHDHTSIVCSRWESLLPLLADSAFDGILFDSSPPVPFSGSSDEMAELVRPFLPGAARILAPGGSLTFVDFGGAIAEVREFQSDVEQIGSIEQITVDVAIPADCEYARGSQATLVVLRTPSAR